MLLTKFAKGLLILAAATFLFACASKNNDTSTPIDTGNVETNDPVVTQPPAKTAEELEAERKAAEAAANAAVREARTIYFDLDDDTLSSDARTLLAAHAWFLVQPENSSIVITVEGHCDERGTPAYNLALGERRAKAIAQHLMLNGVSSSQIQSVSHGEEKPAAFGHDESAWSQNRRGVLNYEG